MSRHTRLGFTLVTAMLLSVAAFAQSPVVYNTTADFTQNPAQLTLNGTNFGVSTPTVLLNNTQLTLVNYTNTQIVASLPPNTVPGSYLIRLVAQVSELTGCPRFARLLG